MRTQSLIIGGTRGMGRTLVEAFVRDHHDISVLGRHRPPEAKRASSSVTYWTADALDLPRLEKTLRQIVKHHGKFHNLIFFQRYRGSGDDWDGEIGTTLTATHRIIEKIAPHFDRVEGGSVVLVSSLAAQRIASEQPLSYHVAKAGLNQMAAYYAVTLGPKRIRVNCVSPGTVIKEESKEFYQSNPKMSALYRKTVPLGRLAKAEDVADVIAYLCSARASFVTGQNIVIDGGLSLVLQDSLARKRVHPRLSS